MRLGDSKWRSVLEGLREGRYQDVLGRRAHGGVWDMPCGIRLDTGNGLLRDEHGSRQTVPEVSRDGLTFRVNGGRNVLRWWVSIQGWCGQRRTVSTHQEGRSRVWQQKAI